MKRVLIFLVIMYLVVLSGSVVSIWALGYSERAIGTPLDNFSLSAAAFVPIVILGAAGFAVVGRRLSDVPIVLIAFSALISGALVFAWAFVAPLIPSAAVNIAAFCAYCVSLGVASGFVLSRVNSNYAA